MFVFNLRQCSVADQYTVATGPGKGLGYSDPDRCPHPEFGRPELKIFQLKKE